MVMHCFVSGLKTIFLNKILISSYFYSSLHFLHLANIIKPNHHVHDYWLNMSIESHGLLARVECLKVVETLVNSANHTDTIYKLESINYDNFNKTFTQ